MGGTLVVIQASTIVKLREKTEKWVREARESGMEVRSGWGRDRVRETKSGFKITVVAHT